MGLDCFWRDTDPSAPSIEPPLNLCGGICLGHGDDSFRGKVYSGLIYEITGESLYQEEITNERVSIMATRLRAFVKDNPGRTIIPADSYKYSYTPNELEQLTRMFEHHATYGSKLLGWW